MSYSQLVKHIRRGTLDDVKTFVTEYPQSVTARDESTGRLAIHYAVKEYNNNNNKEGSEAESFDKLALLLRLHPKGATERDDLGRLPLHILALQRTFRPEMLRLLLEASRSATGVCDCKGSLPLHLAMKNRRQNFDTAMILLQEHEGDIHEIGKGLNIPLFDMALQHRAPDEFIRLLVQRAPAFVQMKNASGDLPLSTALRGYAPLEQLQFLVNAYPGALQVPNDNGELPLHYIVGYGNRHDNLRLLMARYPQGLSIKNAEGQLPFHCAMYNASISLESLNLLHDAYPLSILAADGSGNTSLALVCRLRDEKKAAWLIAKSPASVRAIADQHGNLHVHLVASARSSTLGILKRLVKAFPESLLEENNEGYLPLHSSLATQFASFEAVRFLLEACPEAASRPNRLGQLPLHVACSFHHPIEAVDLLIKFHPEALAMYDCCGYLPFHNACVLRDGNAQLIHHLIAKLQGPTLPLTSKGLPPLFLACEHEVALDVIFLLVHRSLELVSGGCRRLR